MIHTTVFPYVSVPLCRAVFCKAIVPEHLAGVLYVFPYILLCSFLCTFCIPCSVVLTLFSSAQDILGGRQVLHTIHSTILPQSVFLSKCFTVGFCPSIKYHSPLIQRNFGRNYLLTLIKPDLTM